MPKEIPKLRLPEVCGDPVARKNIEATLTPKADLINKFFNLSQVDPEDQAGVTAVLEHFLTPCAISQIETGKETFELWEIGPHKYQLFNKKLGTFGSKIVQDRKGAWTISYE